MNLGTRLLARCVLVNLSSLHRQKIAAASAWDDAFKRQSLEVFHQDGLTSHGVWDSGQTLWPTYHALRWIIEKEGLNVSWHRGLKQERDQAKRLERLQEGGLELWTRPYSTSVIEDELEEIVDPRT